MIRQALLAAAFVCLASGCRHSNRLDPGYIVVALSNSPTNLDPGVGLDEASQRVHPLLFSSLLKLDDQLRIVRDLALRFDTTDWKTYVAEIPRGVKFHDGREMTSGDVAYTFQRFLDPAFVSGKKGAYRNLVAVEPVDRYTVEFRLREPSASFPANLTNMGIVPAGTGATASREPIGSGPYRLTAFLPDDRVTLEAFRDYYQGPPRNSGLVIKVVPDVTMRGLELRKGDVDLVVNDLSPDIIFDLEKEPRLAVTRSPGVDYAYIGLNLRDPVLKSPAIRQALAYAVDRAAIVKYLQRDFARETPGILPSMSWAYDRDLFRFTYDPAKARALLDEAGFPDPDGAGPAPRLTLTLKTSTAEAYRLQAAVLQQQLQAVGIALEIRSYEFATLFADVIRGNVQLYTLVFVGGSVADPDILYRVFHSSQVPPSGFNRAHYGNPDVDRLLDRATFALSEADRRQYYVAAQRIIATEVPLISLWARNNVAVAQSDVSGVSLSPIADFDFLRNVTRKP